MPPLSTTSRDPRQTTTGVLYALAAFGTWGVIAPVHFKLLSAVSALEILAQRIVWAALLVLVLIRIGRRGGELAVALGTRRTLGMLCLSAALVGGNWLIYIWAVAAGQLVETSLGYFINPLVSVVLGILFLGERLRPLQVVAFGVATVGVLLLALKAGSVPWIALSLAISFGFYGLIRKTVPVEPLVGFAVETLVLLPAALACAAYLGLSGQSAFFRGDWRLDLLLVLTGATTSAPLIWFAAAARRLKLSTVGLLQYSSPSCILALGVLVYGEPFTREQALAFAAIWTALALYSVDALRASRAPAPRSSGAPSTRPRG